MLEVKNLSISYGQHQALSDVSLTVAEREVVVILGANGAGKSSLLRAVAGLCKGHLQGDVNFNGDALIGQTPDEIVTNGIALVPEGRAIFGDLSVEENLRLGAYNERAQANQMANLDRVLELFPKLRERRKQVARTMSGGEQQMVAIGRALMSDPTILMLDEPSLGLSPLLSKELFLALGKIRESGLGVLVVEQNAKLSLAIANRGYLIENGRIVGANDAAALAADPAVQAAYLGGGKQSIITRSASRKPGVNMASAADKTPVEPVVQSAESQIFVQPSAQPTSVVNVENVLGESIDSLLSRASDVATQRPTITDISASVKTETMAPAPVTPSDPAPTTTPKRPKIVEISPSTAPKPVSNQASDPAITSLLADFETAAKQASDGKPSLAPIGIDHKRTSYDGAPEDHIGAPLPAIPVFKKARIEVYKRDTSGALVKSREG